MTQENISKAQSFGKVSSFWSKIFGILGPFDISGIGNIPDPAFRSRTEIIVQIFRLIDYPENLEISVAAMHVINELCESPIFSPQNKLSPHRLYSILERSGELSSIMESFIRRLEREETENVFLLDPSRELMTGESDESIIASFGLANLVRLQILDFFINNVKKTGYNLAHFLLGFNTEIITGPASSLPPISEEGEYQNCLQLIVELLLFGLGQPSAPIVALDHPSLGQKCYQLLNELLRNPSTASVTTNFLRSYGDFFKRQLYDFPFGPIDVADKMFTIFECLQKSELLKGVALNLHLSFQEGSWSYLKQFLRFLVLGPFDSSNRLEEPILKGHFKSAAHILEPDYVASFSVDLRSMFLDSVSTYLKSLLQLLELVFLVTSSIVSDRRSMLELQHIIISYGLPAIHSLVISPTTPRNVLEQCCTSLLSFAAFISYLRSSVDEDSKVSQVDDEDCFEIASLMASNPEGSIHSMGFSCVVLLCLTFGRDCSDVQNAKLKTVMMNILVGDNTAALSVNNGWKSVLFSLLISCLQMSNIEALIDFLFKSGILKNIIVSLRSYERTFFPHAPLTFEAGIDASGIYLWETTFTLFEKLVSTEQNAVRLLELGLLDTVSCLQCLEIISSLKADDLSAARSLYPIISPVLRLLEALSLIPSTLVRANLKNLVLLHGKFFCHILGQWQVEHDALVEFPCHVASRIILSLAYSSSDIRTSFIDSSLGVLSCARRFSERLVVLFRFIVVSLVEIEGLRELTEESRMGFLVDTLLNVVNIVAAEPKDSLQDDILEPLFYILLLLWKKVSGSKVSSQEFRLKMTIESSLGKLSSHFRVPLGINRFYSLLELSKVK